MFITLLASIQVSKEDEHLGSFLSNWSYLNLFLKDSRLEVDSELIGKLLKLEYTKRKRPHMLRRLLAKYFHLAKKEAELQLLEICGEEDGKRK